MSVFAGLDVHKKYCHATAMDESGKVLFQEKFPSEPEEFQDLADRLGNEAEVAIEATYAWQYVYEQLEGEVEDVRLAHPKRTRIITDEKIKTDAKASEALAQLTRTGWLPEAWVPPKEVRMLQEKLRRRAYLVCKRTGFKNKIKAGLAKQGIRRDFSYSEDDRKWLENLEIDSINDYLSIIEALNEPIERLKGEIKKEARKDEDTKLVMSIPGIGFIWGLTITTEIGDVGRFPDPKKLCSYAGLVPSTEQSGSKEVHGSIAKEGNKYLRWAMVECSWSHLQHGEDTHLIRFFKRLARKKPDQVAIVAMARKMLTVIYWMLKRGEEFRPQG
ncbi:hypothetical protein AKJ41_00585 [candidate division MSBL1 archaeon SCGC-AAA259O05]|uniref:Uncharacterized protein n=1 Tax=candidate division MSBL1 archaeon SCGC-AAA259O05 TaxID=1698271 RepID=A0A133V5J3_9EURY|nr:hypothetical protein AKJ41_00585 [candidate division MSBL1 archaeon SCGC-AAA259O05]